MTQGCRDIENRFLNYSQGGGKITEHTHVPRNRSCAPSPFPLVLTEKAEGLPFKRT